MDRIAAISATGLAVFVIAGCTGSAGMNADLEAHQPPPKVVSVSPAPGSTRVNGAGRVTVTYTQPLPAGDELPRLAPAIAGTWQRIGDKAIFTPRAGFPAQTRVTVSALGAGTTKAGKTSMTVTKATFTTGSYSTLGLQQLLAQLGYLPLTWMPVTRNVPVAASSANAQLSAAYSPPPGTFSWQPGYPSELHNFWRPGQPSLILTGAVMTFEFDHGMAMDGDAGSGVWHALLAAVADALVRANHVPPARRAAMADASATIRQRSSPIPDKPLTP